MIDRSRLLWQCRRGMLELDILLQEFVDRHLDQLSITQQQAFERLLNYPDLILLDFLLGRTTPIEASLVDVVQKIRRPANS